MKWHQEQNGINSNVPIIKGNAIGNGNCLLPLYINPLHWQLSKEYMGFMLGLMINKDPLGFCQRHILYPFKILISMVYRIYTCDNFQNEKMIYTYYAVFRTCAQIAIENNYTRGINKMIESYPSLTPNYEIILGEIISSGHIMKDDDILNFVRKVVKYHLDLRTKKCLKLDKLDSKENKENHREPIIKMFDKPKILEYLSEIYVFCYSFYIFQRLMREVYASTKYNQLLKLMDKNYGLISEDICKLTVKHFRENRFELKNMINNGNKIEKCIDECVNALIS